MAIPVKLVTSLPDGSTDGEQLWPAYNFSVAIGTFEIGNFSEVSGLSAEIETEDYRAGGVNGFVYKLPTVVRPSSVSLKRGMTRNKFLRTWFGLYADSSMVLPLPLSISLKAADAKASLNTFVLSNAYPAKWDGPDLNAQDASLAIESVELVHQGFWKF